MHAQDMWLNKLSQDVFVAEVVMDTYVIVH